MKGEEARDERRGTWEMRREKEKGKRKKGEDVTFNLLAKYFD